MSEELNKEILLELKKINQKLDEINESPKGLSTPMKLIAFFIGITVIGPFIAIFLSSFFE